MNTHPPKNCPFCDPSIIEQTWLETETYRVVYNIAPIVPGHSLVMPKRHVSTLLALTEAEVAGLFRTARRAVRLLLQAFQGEGFDLSLQDGQVAGQTVPHLHVHVLPRKPGDLAPDQDWYEQVLDSGSRARLSDEEMRRVVEWLRGMVEA